MSAPETDVETQAERHRPSLVGIALSVGLALLMFGLFIAWLAARGDAPETPETRIDGRTGAEVEAD